MQDMQEKRGGNVFAIATMFALFFMIAFVTNFASPMGVIAKNQFNASNALSQLGNAANFIAYLFMGIPGGLILKRKGYKMTSLIAVAVGIAGLGIQLLSGYISSFPVYVLGAFVAGFSMCMLNLVANPLLNTLGGEGKKGNQLVQFACSLNSVGATVSPIVLGMIIGEVNKQTSFIQASPALMVAIAIFAVAFFIVALSRIPEPHMETAEEKALRLQGGSSVMKDIVETLKFRHFTFGALAICFYIVIEVGVPAMGMNYMTDTAGPGYVGGAVAGAVCGAYWFFMMIGRLVGGLVGGKISSRVQASFLAVCGIVLLLAAIFTPVCCVINIPAVPVSFWYMLLTATVIVLVSFGLAKLFDKKLSLAGITGLVSVVILLWHVANPEGLRFGEGFTIPTSMLFMACVGFCTSVMWGSIFNMAAEGLGKYISMGSGIFMTMVSGGLLIPVQGMLADTVGLLNSYWLSIGLLAYILFYALVLSKPTKRAA